MSTVLDELDLPTEELVVGWWRFSQFERLGFEHNVALDLADSPNADLDLARRLIRDGCPHETAFEILA